MIVNTILNYSNMEKAKAESIGSNGLFNCWGATLYVLNKIETLEWIDGYEMRHFLDNETFSIDESQLQIGDILVLNSEYAPEGELLHTAVYIGNNLFYHKRGQCNSAEASLAEILEEYCDYISIEYRRLN